MADPYDFVPEDIKKEAVAESEQKGAKDKKSPKEGSKESGKKGGGKEKEPKITGAEKKQHGPFKKKRAGVVLSKDEVKAIKAGRKKLRREMKARGIKSKREFELTAGSLGLYFDKRSAFWAWLLSHWLVTLIGLGIALLLVLTIFSLVQQIRGHFTINLSEGMFKEGFVLADNVEFENPTTYLFANPAQDVPCISVTQIPANIDQIDGEHNDLYFAYTYYIRNEGESTVDYTWSLDMNAETQNVSEAVWVLLFEDGRMRMYAKANKDTGEKEALPPKDDDTRGYTRIPIMGLSQGSDQFEVVKQQGQITYWRVIPDKFLTDTCITRGEQKSVEPMEAHKYTVVLWLEGDDVSADDSLIGGHMGVEMGFRLTSETEKDAEDGNSGDRESSSGNKWRRFWDNIWSGLK